MFEPLTGTHSAWITMVCLALQMYGEILKVQALSPCFSKISCCRVLFTDFVIFASLSVKLCKCSHSVKR